MSCRYGEIKADIRVPDFDTDSNGLIRVRLSRWMRKSQIGDVIMVGDAEDEQVLFTEVVGFEGELARWFCSAPADQ